MHQRVDSYAWFMKKFYPERASCSEPSLVTRRPLQDDHSEATGVQLAGLNSTALDESIAGVSLKVRTEHGIAHRGPCMFLRGSLFRPPRCARYPTREGGRLLLWLHVPLTFVLVDACFRRSAKRLVQNILCCLEAESTRADVNLGVFPLSPMTPDHLWRLSLARLVAALQPFRTMSLRLLLPVPRFDSS